MSPPPPTRLSLRIRLVAWMLFFLALWNLVRVVVLIQERGFLAEQGLGANTLARLLFSAAWAAGFLAVGVGLWRRWPPARPGVLLILTGYALYNLLLLALFVQSPVERQGWLARLLGYMIALALVAGLLYRPELSRLLDRFRKTT